MRFVLGVQTCTPGGGVALSCPEHVVARTLDKSHGVVEYLMVMIQDLLREAGADSGDLEAIAVATGPGSFSGVRAGCVTAQALAHAWQVPLVAVPTFDAVAFGLAPHREPAAVLFPARTSAWYLALLDRFPDHWSYRIPPVDLERAAIIARLDVPLRLVAPADAMDEWRSLLPGLVVEAQPDGCYPTAGMVASAGRFFLQQGKRVAPDALRPHYVAPPRITSPRSRPQSFLTP